MHDASFPWTGRVEDHSGEITGDAYSVTCCCFVALLWFFGMYFSLKTRLPLFEMSKRIVQLIYLFSFRQLWST